MIKTEEARREIGMLDDCSVCELPVTDTWRFLSRVGDINDDDDNWHPIRRG